MKDYSKYIKHIEESLIKVAPKNQQAKQTKLAGYIGTQLKVLGIDTPVQRQMVKENYGILKLEKWMDVISHVYKVSDTFEVKNAALYITDTNSKIIPENVKMEVLPDWINYTDNWAHSDHLSKFYTQLLESEKHGKKFLKTLIKWNNDSNLWKRRQSLVSLYFYARSKKIFLPYSVTEKMIHNLMYDEDYFVQKALGWTLRESFNVYPEETFAYVFKNVSGISPVAFSATIEKMSIKQKEVLKTKRKKSK